jgi:hypothetical protein
MALVFSSLLGGVRGPWTGGRILCLAGGEFGVHCQRLEINKDRNPAELINDGTIGKKTIYPGLGGGRRFSNGNDEPLRRPPAGINGRAQGEDL